MTEHERIADEVGEAFRAFADSMATRVFALGVLNPRQYLGHWPVGTEVQLAESVPYRGSSFYVPGETVTVERALDVRSIVTVRSATGRMGELDAYTPVWSTPTYQR